MKKTLNPVSRGNILNIEEKIKELRPSFAHCLLLQQQIQKAFFLLKGNEMPETDKLLALFTDIHCNGEGAFDSGKFLRVQREALSLLSVVLGEELVRPA